jgi:hypothetical protein
MHSLDYKQTVYSALRNYISRSKSESSLHTKLRIKNKTKIRVDIRI